VSSGFILFLLVSLFPGCGREEHRTEGAPSRGAETAARAEGERSISEALEILDAERRTLVLEAYPERIISLVPSATQTLMSLGVQDLLVARTDFDTEPALEGLPSVGPGLQPSLETLLGLGPDLVIRFAGESDRVTPRRLQELGIPQFAVRPDRIADVRGIILDLGSITGRHGSADSLLSAMDSTFQEIRRRLQGRTPPRVAYLLGGNPPWVASGGTFVDELVQAAGGSNVFGDMEALYGPISPEELLVRDIDLLLIPLGSEWALPENGIPVRWVSPSVELPGLNLAQAALELARVLHPEAFR
jgi:iron complex transport system substrate-binding protein